MRKAGCRRVDGLAEGGPKRPTSVRAALTVICWPRTARTAISKPSNAPGSRKPGRGDASCAQRSADFRGVAGKIEQPLYAREHGRNSAHQRRRHLDFDGRLTFGWHDCDPAGMLHIAIDGSGPCVDSGCLRSARRPRSRASPRMRADAVQSSGGRYPRLESEDVGYAGAGQALAQIRRTQPIARAEQSVEAAQAAEAARHRDAGHAERRVGEQPFGEQQAVRLCILDRRYTQLVLKHAAQMAVGDTQTLRELLDAALVEQTVFDQSRRGVREPRCCVYTGIAGGELRPAAHARTIAGGFGCSSARIERAILLLRRLDRAHGTAIDSRGRDADEKAAVEACIAGSERLITGNGIE